MTDESSSVGMSKVPVDPEDQREVKMRNLGAIEFVSLDGVFQAPGDPNEDTEGGFEHGGWQRPYFDDVMAASAAEGMARTDAHLFGRKTYQIMAAYWPNAPADDPFAMHLNNVQKYVASNTLRDEDVTWQHTTLLNGDVAQRIREIKEQPGGGIGVLGSGTLVRWLLDNDLLDELTLAVYPLTLGGGKRVFADDGRLRRFELVHSETTGTGGLILRYRPAR
jgi:dihydrofolate reductase